MLFESIILAMAVLGLSLITQWRVVLGDNDKWTKLGKLLSKWAYIVFIPIGIAFLLIGLIVTSFIESFVSVGVVLIILSIILIIQTQVLSSPEDKTVSLGRNIRLSAFIFAGMGCAAVILLIIRIIQVVISSY